MENQTPPIQSPPVENSIAQEAPPPPPKSFLSNKILLIVVILILILAVGGTYLALNSKLKPQPVVSDITPTSVPTPTPDPTSSWKTYENSKYNFSFKHPASLTIEDKSNQFPPFTIFVSDKNKSVPYEGGNTINPYMIIQSKSSDISLNDYINNPKNNLEMVRDQNVEKNNFIVAKEKFGMGVAPDNYMIKNGNNILSISNSLYSIDGLIFNQILSTFRFD